MTLMELSVQYRANAAALRERALALEGRRRSEPGQAGRLLDSRIQQLRAMWREARDWPSCASATTRGGIDAMAGTRYKRGGAYAADMAATPG